MEEDMVENPPEIKSRVASDDPDVKEECQSIRSPEDDNKRNEDAPPAPELNSCFKVPDDIAFTRPIFTKVIKKSTAVSHSIENAAETQKEESGSEESSSQSQTFVNSPAQQLVEKSVPLPYKEPPWSGLPKLDYSFEVLKNGIIVGSIPLDKPFIVIGRLAQCDITMEHPSLSRFHCVIQYRMESSGKEDEEEGFYCYDLGSTHGSFHNKYRMKPHTYYRLRVGHMIKFGGSSRMLILQGPDEDQEPESELTVTELKAKTAKRVEKLDRLEDGEIEEEDGECHRKEETKEADAGKKSDGIDWGMGEDAKEDEADDGVNPFATLNEDLFLNDPKKTLRGWFEREGYDLPEYVAEDISPGVYKCKVDLPIPGPGGGPLVAIAQHRGKKKDAVIQCALEACRLLNKQGVLRQAKHESHEKKRKDWAKNDYYDSDEDDFLDRTGDVQRKRLRRMKTAAKGSDIGAETYDSLMSKYKEVTEELSSLEKKLAEAERVKREAEVRGEDEDDLDSFMKNLKRHVPDKHKRVNWKLRSVDLRKEELRLRRLVNVAKPFNSPELQPYISEFDFKPNLPAKHPFSRPSDPSRESQTLLKKPKEIVRTIHKAFLEEEPETKVKLRRLDDREEDELRPIPYKGTKPKPRYSTVIKEGARIVPPPGTSVSDGKRGNSEPSEAMINQSDGRQQSSEPSEAIGNQNDGRQRSSEPAEAILILDNEKQQSSELSKVTASQYKLGDEVLSARTPGLDSAAAMPKMTIQQTHDVRVNLAEGVEDNPTNTGPDEERPKEKRRHHVMGPTLPTLDFLKVTKQQDPLKVKNKPSKKSANYDTDVSKYETWVPPSNQTGDGRTSLNEKYGY